MRHTTWMTASAVFFGLASVLATPDTAAACRLGIGDRVWQDNNGNGIQYPGEPGINGVRVTISPGFFANPLDETSFVTSVVTANGPGEFGAGYYLFNGVRCDTDYTIAVDASTLPAGVQPTLVRVGADSALDYEIDCRLVRDFSNYAITPHTDTPKKLVSLLFYLPEDESMKALGTSLYAPIDPNFRCEGRKHHAFGAFKRITTMPYLPNTLFGFFKTDNAFHGVERIEMPRIQRDSVLYNIYVRNVGRRSPATQA